MGKSKSFFTEKITAAKYLDNCFVFEISIKFSDSHVLSILFVCTEAAQTHVARKGCNVIYIT